MKETSPDEPYIDRLRTWAKTKVHGGNRSTAARQPGDDSERDGLPLSSTAQSSVHDTISTPLHSTNTNSNNNNHGGVESSTSSHGPAAAPVAGPDDSGTEGGTQLTPSPQASRKGSQLGTDAASESNNNNNNEKTSPSAVKAHDNVAKRFLVTSRNILFHSWLNALLVFVPVGIAVNFVPNMSPAVIFAMNAIAIIPLAGLLSHATETVAHRMGDAIGALLNITFGNAVELIILYVTCCARACAGVRVCVCACVFSFLERSH